MKLFGSDVAVDLGTASLRMSLRGKGVVLRAPTVLAVEKPDGHVLQVGQDALKMLGRTPANLAAIRPLRAGVISDYDMTVKLLREHLRSILPFSTVKPRLLFSVPGGVSSVDQQQSLWRHHAGRGAHGGLHHPGRIHGRTELVPRL